MVFTVDIYAVLAFTFLIGVIVGILFAVFTEID